MLYPLKKLVIFTLFASSLPLPMASARTIFLNGQDISSAYGERLQNVDIFIDKNGDIFISGPQYKVILESTRSPLSLALDHQEADRGSQETGDQLHRRMQQEASSRTINHELPQGQRMKGVQEPATDELPEMLAK